jgi:hypothetical protein
MRVTKRARCIFRKVRPGVILLKNTEMRAMTQRSAKPTHNPVGPHIVKVNDTIPYSVPLRVGALYFWDVTGGIVLLGQGTNQVLIKWARPGAGIVRISTQHRDAMAEPGGLSVTIK